MYLNVEGSTKTSQAGHTSVNHTTKHNTLVSVGIVEKVSVGRVISNSWLLEYTL